MSLARFGDFSAFVKFLSFSAIGGATTYYLMNPREKKPVSSKNLVIATGCDSGLGYSIAALCHNLNISVVACVHSISSNGATKLSELFGNSKRFHLVELEVTEADSVKSVKDFVEDLLEKNKDLRKSTHYIAKTKVFT